MNEIAPANWLLSGRRQREDGRLLGFSAIAEHFAKNNL